MADKKRTGGERLAVSDAQASGGSRAPVEGIREDTSHVNPDSGNGASEQGGMAGPVGYFEGEGNEGPVAPVGGATTKSATDGETNSQGGVASGAPG
jgi:hypothetical protein